MINYDVPEHAEDYVHRIGRTGRAQREGDAATILAPEEQPKLDAIEKLIGANIPQCRLEDFNYFYEPSIQKKPPPSLRRRRNSAVVVLGGAAVEF